MIIATRVLTLLDAEGDKSIPIRVFAPMRQEIDWSCRVEIDWPEKRLSVLIGGFDAIHALDLAMKFIGTQIYTSVHHESGKLVWVHPGDGYGFPVPNTIRDLLVGYDKKYH